MGQSYDYFIQWHLTDRCNLACRHCYQQGIGFVEMPTGRIISFMDDHREMLDGWGNDYDLDVSGSYQFTGGEPMLRDDIYDILDAARALNFTTYLLTNGTLIDKDAAARLADTGVKAVQVSLEGAPATHDAIRGDGGFAAAASGITALAGAGVEVTVNVTLSKRNVDEIEEVTELAAGLGATRVGFGRLVPEGRGLSMISEMLSPAELTATHDRIRALRVSNIAAICRDPLNFRNPEDNDPSLCGSTAVAGCAAGLSGITILPDGTVMPCRRMNIAIGNINATPLRELWASSPILEELRDKSAYTGKCGDCDRWDVCRGCRAIAYAASIAAGAPDYLTDDPQCGKPCV
jgi:radical SAM protein with 4Fe4S-binding SPASM domain